MSQQVSIRNPVLHKIVFFHTKHSRKPTYLVVW